ncbi:hypothetical protein [Flammeovirga sp. SJP92]|uniref:hypothetical protein n=1 Tax=Flammeovirga sp. SJP92 TaxID=1775430 RepID=UPI0007874AB0|nr:hypothetical protein [Flammeovirga sp. SJP92]KXX71930.1 hypothetical protein AVL50_03860 [Flammeovirga sp. SJP92]
MKTLESISFRNFELIEEYLNGKLSPVESQTLLRRLTIDHELREDFDLVVEMSTDMVSWPIEKKNRIRIAFATRHSKAVVSQNKANLAKDLVAYGTATIAAAGLLVFVSGLFVFFAS